MKFLTIPWKTLLSCSLISASAMAADYSVFTPEDANEDNGTELFSKTRVKVKCTDDGMGILYINSMLGTTGAVAPTEVYGRVSTDKKFIYQNNIQPQDFIHNDRNKWTQNFWDKLKAKNGKYWAQACYLQKGHRGRTEKSVCSDPYYFKVGCSVSTCSATLDGQWETCNNTGSEPASQRIRLKADSSTVSVTLTDFSGSEGCGKFRISKPSCDSSRLEPIDYNSNPYSKTSW